MTQHAHPVPPVVSIDDLLEIVAENPMCSTWDIIRLAYPRIPKGTRSCLYTRVSFQIRDMRSLGLVEVVGKDGKTLLYGVPRDVRRPMSEMVPTEEVE